MFLLAINTYSFLPGKTRCETLTIDNKTYIFVKRAVKINQADTICEEYNATISFYDDKILKYFDDTKDNSTTKKIKCLKKPVMLKMKNSSRGENCFMKIKKLRKIIYKQEKCTETHLYAFLCEKERTFNNNNKEITEKTIENFVRKTLNEDDKPKKKNKKKDNSSNVGLGIALTIVSIFLFWAVIITGCLCYVSLQIVKHKKYKKSKINFLYQVYFLVYD